MAIRSISPAPNLTFVLGEDGCFQAWVADRPGLRIMVDAEDLRLLAEVAGGPPAGSREGAPTRASRIERLLEKGVLSDAAAGPGQ